MRPAARVQAAIELLDGIIEATRKKGPPADRLIGDYFKQRRYAGSKDRRAVRELVYSAIRACGPVPEWGRAAMLRLAETDESIRELFDGSDHGPKALLKNEVVAKGGVAPQWLVERLAVSGVKDNDLASLLERAPLDIRVNTLKADRESIELPDEGEKLASPNALRFPTGTKVEQWDAYRDGVIEVQDHGSQLACSAVDPQPGQVIIDLCAGAGGKTLGLAAKSDGKAIIIAADTDKRRLGNLAPRALKAGAQVNHTVLLDPGKELEALAEWAGKADTVLVDAPCSGTGTWRRNPEGRWRITPNELDKLAATQDRLLDIAAKLTKPGGQITYVTCSLLDEEGADRITAFLARNSKWVATPPSLPLGEPHGKGRGKGLRLTPYQHGTDGFFVAMLRSPC
ncbi:MAG: RsmB/NOP family class I SAM-dependent RNA methyltransferase [Marinomonas sp.]